MKTTRLSGLIAAPFTPFNADYSLNLKVIPAYVKHLVQQKVTGAFVGGSTGEYASLTQDERMSLAAAWRAAAGPALKIVVHVGHNSLFDSCALASQAESIGADAIAALMPSYFKPAGLRAVVEFSRAIAAAAPKTPFYYYHIPDMTGVHLEMATLFPELVRHVPTFRGIKFTHSNVMDYSLTVAAGGDDYDILFGRDEILLAGLGMGATGAVGSTYNYAAGLYLELMKAHAAGNSEAARKQQVYIQRAILPIIVHGGQTANKAIMAMAGVDCGLTRPPLLPLSRESHAAVRSELDAINFFAAIKGGDGVGRRSTASVAHSP
ncbi:MAG: dihydrodipicolinate synthetase [Verrucomicrobia bacterium]|nr:dihydrodipicolinate synthetase [Verrucomicrobiota bacterium]